MNRILSRNNKIKVAYKNIIDVGVDGYSMRYSENEDKILKKYFELKEKYGNPEPYKVEYNGKTFTISQYEDMFGNKKLLGLDVLVKRKTKNNPTIRVKDIIDMNEVKKHFKLQEEKILSSIEVELEKFIDENIELSEENKRAIEIFNLQDEFEKATDKKQWLKDNGFKNYEIWGYHTEQPDGYGHTCGVSAMVDFKNKEVVKHYWSSDD